MAAKKVPMTQRRAEELSFVALRVLFSPSTRKNESFELHKGFSDDEFFELLELVAPELVAEINAKVEAEWNPLEHLDEILSGAAKKMKENEMARMLADSPCPACAIGKLDYPPFAGGLRDLSGPLTCSECKMEFPQ